MTESAGSARFNNRNVARAQMWEEIWGCPKSVGVAAVGLKCGCWQLCNTSASCKLRRKYYKRCLRLSFSETAGRTERLTHVASYHPFVQSCKMLITPKPRIYLYALFMYRDHPRFPEGLSCMPPVIYTARKPDSVSVNRRRPDAEAPMDRALSSFDCHRGHELGRGRQLLGPPDPTGPHDLEITDEEDEHELDTAAS